MGNQRRADLNAVYNGFVFTPFDRAAAIASAQVRRDLGKKGIGLADAFIAGQAIADGFTLVSNNTRHFARVQGLHLVNWAI